MSIELASLVTEFERLWPIAGAESWDSPGLSVGNSGQRISRVLLTVDLSSEIISEAQDGLFDLVLSHHPLLFKGVQSVSEATVKGSLISSAIRSNIAIYSAHTNADVVLNGVSHTLALALGLENPLPLVSNFAPRGDDLNSEQNAVGHGRVGNLSASMQLGDFARLISKVIPPTASGIRVSGDYHQLVNRVAVCGGAGDSFVSEAMASGADVFVSSDLRHHVTQDAREQGLISSNPFALIDISHWASEWLWLEVAASQLSKVFPSVQFVVSELRTDPWDFVVTQ